MNRQKAIEPLTEDEVLSLIHYCNPRSPSGARNQALIALAFWSGLRVAELIALRPSDVDSKARTVNVRRGKGGRQRVAVLGLGAIPYLEGWARQRTALGIGPRRPLLCTISEGANALAGDGEMERGQPLTQPYIGTMLTRVANRAGVTKRVHAHGLRHSHAVMLNSKGVSVAHIQSQLGHASLASTQVYLSGISTADRAAAIGSVI